MEYEIAHGKKDGLHIGYEVVFYIYYTFLMNGYDAQNSKVFSMSPFFKILLIVAISLNTGRRWKSKQIFDAHDVF